MYDPCAPGISSCWISKPKFTEGDTSLLMKSLKAPLNNFSATHAHLFPGSFGGLLSWDSTD